MRSKSILVVVMVSVLALIQTAMADLSSFPICTNSANQSNPAVSGNIVVWRDERSGSDIYGKDISTGNELAICTESANQYYPAVSGDVVVWQVFTHTILVLVQNFPLA